VQSSRQIATISVQTIRFCARRMLFLSPNSTEGNVAHYKMPMKLIIIIIIITNVLI